MIHIEKLKRILYKNGPVEKINEIIDALNDAFADYITQDQFNAFKTYVNNKFGDVNTAITNNGNKIAANKNEIDALKTRTKTIEGNVATNATNIAHNANDIASLKNSVAANLANIQKNANDITKLQTDVQKNANDIANSHTDTKVNVTLGTTTKAFLLGTATTPTATATGVTAISDTGVYLTTTAGQIYCTSVALKSGIILS